MRMNKRKNGNQDKRKHNLKGRREDAQRRKIQNNNSHEDSIYGNNKNNEYNTHNSRGKESNQNQDKRIYNHRDKVNGNDQDGGRWDRTNREEERFKGNMRDN